MKTRLHPRRAGPVVLLALALPAAPLARAGGNAETVCITPTPGMPNPTCQAGQIVDIAWSSYAQPVRWWMNQNGVGVNTEHGGLPLDPAAALVELQAAFATWQDVPESSISFRSMGTSAVSTSGLDNTNLVYWSDTELGIGILATTTWFMLTADIITGPGTHGVLDPAIYPDGARLNAGTIVDADITLNSRDFDWSLTPNSTPGICDIRAVATHEAGHFHGLAHSAALRELATMFAFFDTTSASQQQAARSLEWDDVAASARIYPASGTGPSGALSGRVMTAAGDGVVGAQVSAVDVVTGREVVSVFTNSALKVGGGGAGAYRLDRLPPGTYEVAVDYLRRSGQSNTGWRWLDAEHTKYSTTLTLLDRPGEVHLDPDLVSPELLSPSGYEGPSDDLAPALTVTLGAADQRTLPDLIANEYYPPALSGSTQLHLGDNTIIFGVPIPFGFQFYGTSYTMFAVCANGYLTFGSTYDSCLGETGGDFFQYPRVAGLLRDLNPAYDGVGPGGPDVYVTMGSASVVTTWLAVPEKIPAAETSSTSPTSSGANTFSIGFDSSGRVWLDYQRVSSPLAMAGISAGDSLTGIAEKYDFGRPRPLFPDRPTLENAVRLSGLHVEFAPHPLGGYVATSPQWTVPEVAPPGGVGSLSADGIPTTVLSWPAAATALRYRVYRNRVDALRASGAYTDPDSCFTTVMNPQASDSGAPGPGRVFFYLVTAVREFAIEGSLGKDSRGSERLNPVPCR